MNEADTEVIREVWRRWNEGRRDLDPKVTDPDLEIHSALAGTAFRGADGLAKWMAEIDDQFEGWEIAISELREVGPGAYLVHGEIKALGRQSGLRLDQPASWLVGVREGRIWRLHNFIGPDARQRAEAEAA